MAAYTQFFIDQNSDFNISIYLTDGNGIPIDLTGYELEGKFRKSFDSEVEYTLNVFTTEADTGNVSISLAAANSVNIEPGKYEFDLGFFDDSSRTRFLEGQLIINPSVL